MFIRIQIKGSLSVKHSPAHFFKPKGLGTFKNLKCFFTAWPVTDIFAVCGNTGCACYSSAYSVFWNYRILLLKFCKIQKADFFIFSENLHLQFYIIICPSVRTWKSIFRFWFEAGFLHFFSLKNLQKLYKWGVTIMRKNVRCILKGHKNHADKMNLHRRFNSTVSLFVEKFFWADTCFLAKKCTLYCGRGAWRECTNRPQYAIISSRW